MYDGPEDEFLHSMSFDEFIREFKGIRIALSPYPERDQEYILDGVIINRYRFRNIVNRSYVTIYLSSKFGGEIKISEIENRILEIYKTFKDKEKKAIIGPK